MGKLIVVLTALMCASCTLEAHKIQPAPVNTNLAVVFDIDGTLTPQPSAIFTAREDAAKAVHIFSDAGYKIIYLSARVKLLQARIPGWLEANQFPKGSIHVPQSSEDSADHGAFKSRILAGYLAEGWHLSAAFGDTSSDFQAYHNAGIPKAQVFALQRANSDSCQTGVWAGCWTGWTDHLALLAKFAQLAHEDDHSNP